LYPKCHKEDLRKIRVNLLRLQAQAFCDLPNSLKLHCVHFASKSWLCAYTDNDSQEEQALSEYILGCGRVDVSVDVRDRSRHESAILHNTAEGLKYDVDNLTPLSSSIHKFTMQQTREMILQYKPPSSWLPLESDDKNVSSFRFGTLSSLVSHKAGNAYLPLPQWAKQDSPSSLRDPILVEDKQSKLQRNVLGVNENMSPPDKFYEEETDGTSDSEYTSSEDENNESSSSDEDDTSYIDSSNEDISSTFSDSSGISTSKKGTVEVGTLVPLRVTDTTFDVTASNTNIEVQLDAVQSDEESDSSYETDDSSLEIEITHNEIQKEKLLELSSKTISIDQNSSVFQHPGRSNTNVATLAEGLEGLIMTPLVFDKADLSSVGDIESESSHWKQQVRPELSGGLYVESRFLRGLSREREAKNMSLDPNSSVVFILQIKLENRRTDGSLLRRIRLIQRGVSGSGIHSLHRVKLPQEVGALKQDKKCTLMLGLEFGTNSEKDGNLTAKFDVKSDRGSISIAIRPPLGEMLVPCKMSRDEFNAFVEKMQGIHQRSVHSFSLQNNVRGKTILDQYDSLPDVINKHANLAPVGDKKGWSNDDDCLMLCAELPLSGLLVCVKVKCSIRTKTGEILICCDSTMALNSIMEILKHAVCHS